MLKDGATRETYRVPFLAGAVLRQAERKDCAVVGNLSSGGLLFYAGQVPNGDLELKFPLPDDGPPIRVRAVPRWSRPRIEADGEMSPAVCGVRFVDMTPEDRARIDRQIDEYLEQPTPIHGLKQPRSGLARIPIVLACSLEGEFGSLRGTICNLNVSGVYVAMRDELELGTTARLRVQLPDPIGRIEKRVTVTWSNACAEERPHILPPGHGFRFDDLTRAEIRQLVRLVDAYLARIPRGHG